MATRRTARRANVVTLNVVRRRKKGCARIHRVSAPVQLRSSTDAVLESRDFAGSQDLATDSPLHEEQQSEHDRRKVQAAEGWDKLRLPTLHAAVEGMSLPPNAQCCNCRASAEVRCVQCGPTVFLCQRCTIVLHNNVRFSHTPEIWKVSYDTFY